MLCDRKAQPTANGQEPCLPWSQRASSLVAGRRSSLVAHEQLQWHSRQVWHGEVRMKWRLDIKETKLVDIITSRRKCWVFAAWQGLKIHQKRRRMTVAANRRKFVRRCGWAAWCAWGDWKVQTRCYRHSAEVRLARRWLLLWRGSRRASLALLSKISLAV